MGCVTIRATLGVSIGVGALVSVLSLGDAMQNFVRKELERSTDVRTVVVRAKPVVLVDGEQTPVRGAPQFTTAHLAEMTEALPLAGATGGSMPGVGAPAARSRVSTHGSHTDATLDARNCEDDWRRTCAGRWTHRSRS